MHKIVTHQHWHFHLLSNKKKTVRKLGASLKSASKDGHQSSYSNIYTHTVYVNKHASTSYFKYTFDVTDVIHTI